MTAARPRAQTNGRARQRGRENRGEVYGNVTVPDPGGGERGDGVAQGKGGGGTTTGSHTSRPEGNVAVGPRKEWGREWVAMGPFTTKGG